MNPPPTRPIRLTLAEPMARIEIAPDDGEIVAFDAGPRGSVFVGFALRPLDYSETRESGAMFPKTRTAGAQRYRVIGLEGGEAIDVVTGEEPFNIHFVQPLGEALLLVCARSQYRGPDDIEKNGRVYGRDGAFRRELLLGDGIQSVQTTPSGVIWTSYFDEGIFGNFGWNAPLGEPGLIAWDAAGESLYRFSAPGGFDTMADCYALNVASDSEVWCYYYTDFPLVRIENQVVTGSWTTPLTGAHALAVFGRHVLFRGGYKDRHGYLLCELPPETSGALRPLARFTLHDAAGEELIPERVSARGGSIYLLRGREIYRLDVHAAVRAL